MKKFLNNVKGITLIALVVTIIVLLILAGVTINIAFNTGIIGKSKNATIQYQESSANESNQLANLEEYLDEANEENSKADLIESKTSKTVFKTETTVTDSLGNEMIVPAGFKIASDSAEKISGGVIIEDTNTENSSTGNQFVWVPVGKGIKKSETETVDIELGRYTFNSTTGKAEVFSGNYKEETNENCIGNNAKAKDINQFINSVNKYHGYYFGRYEACTNSEKANSQYGLKCDGSIKPQIKANLGIWNSIKQPDAAYLARNMYNNEKYTSDLVNSYAWDTAILYIEQCGINSSNYANKTHLQSGLMKSGNATDGTKNDVQCNIFDMCGNVVEWSTETELSSKSSTHRGGNISASYDTVSHRYPRHNTYAAGHLGFRIILYLN